MQLWVLHVDHRSERAPDEYKRAVRVCKMSYFADDAVVELRKEVDALKKEVKTLRRRIDTMEGKPVHVEPKEEGDHCVIT